MTENEITRACETCRHFNGTTNEVCDAGIRYDTFVAPGIPCVVRFNKSDHQCPSRAWPTRAEVIVEHEASESRFQEAMKRIQAVAPVVNACRVLAGRKGGQYDRECDACKTGRLHIGIAPNGHARVCCTTENCVNWRE